MKKAGIIIENISEKGVKVIAFILMAVITWWTAAYTCCYPLDYSEEILTVYEDSVIKNVLVFLAIFVLYGVLSWILFRNKNEEQRRKIVRYFAIAETLLVGIALTVWVTATQFGQSRDAQQVYKTTLSFMEGDYSHMEYNYIQGFQQQLNLVFLEELVLRIGGDYRVFQYLNVIFIMAIVFFLYRITDKLFQNQIVNFYCLVTVAGFLPMHLYVNLVYGDICSIALSLVAIWALLNWCDTKQKRYIPIIVLALTIAALARKNTLIIVVAIFICLAIYAWREWEWRAILIGALVTAVMFGSMQIIPTIYEKRSGIELGDSMPAILWVGMGMQGNWGGHGVYNAYNESIFWTAGNDAQKATEYALVDIKARLQEFAEDPAMAQDFYKNKMLEQWGETTYGSMTLTFDDSKDVTGLVEAVYKGGLQGMLVNLQNYYAFVIYFGVLLFLIMSIRKRNHIWQVLPLVIVVGGILFSIIWETKSRYVFGYVICMIPYMAYGVWVIQEKLLSFLKKGK